jgi:hypothetical protein
VRQVGIPVEAMVLTPRNDTRRGAIPRPGVEPTFAASMSCEDPGKTHRPGSPSLGCTRGVNYPSG